MRTLLARSCSRWSRNAAISVASLAIIPPPFPFTAFVLASGACFLLFPLRFGWERPEPEGWTAFLFRALYANDLPFNMAPSLHISLRSLVWIVYGKYLRGRLRTAVKVWFIVIGLSTILVWQHHLIDVAGVSICPRGLHPCPAAIGGAQDVAVRGADHPVVGVVEVDREEVRSGDR